MKIATVSTMRATLAEVRAFIFSTRSTLAELRQQRDRVNADIAALAVRPGVWSEIVDEAVAAAIDDCAARYKPTLAAWIRTSNPNLARRGGYDDLPFLGSLDVSDPGDLQPALCYFLPDLLKPKLRALLLEFPSASPSEECITQADRKTQGATLAARLHETDAEISRLESELAELRG